MAAKGSGTRVKRPERSGRRRPPKPEPRGEAPLSRERIVAMAVELLDAEGIDALTIRRLADCLDSGVMSLYWHIDNKEEVFDLALDAVLEYRGLSHMARSQDWRGDVVHMLEDWRARMLLHPWSAALLPRRVLGPNILRRLEWLGMTLSTAGVADANLNAAIWSLWNYVMGATITRANFAVSDDDRAAVQQRLTHLSGHYPTIGRSRLLLDDDWEGAFRKGLDFLLDGLAPVKSAPG